MGKTVVAAYRLGRALVFLMSAPVLGQAQQGDSSMAGQVVLSDSTTGRTPAAANEGRAVTLDLHSATLAEVLREIVRQSGIELVYSKTVVPLDRRISLKVAGMPALRALAIALQGLDVSVQSNGRAWLLVPKQHSGTMVQSGSIEGRITDAKTGEGVARAEVWLEKTDWRTISDTAGRYRLTQVDTGQYTFSVRRLGYAKQSQQVTIHEAQTDTVNLALNAVAARLQELVTTVTGRQRRYDIGYPVTTIDADSVLQNSPARNLTDLLQNRVPGLTVQHTSGAPGDPAKLRLHGLNSVLRSNDPVVIVDGIRIYSAQSDARSGNLSNLVTGTGSTIPSSARSQGVGTQLPAPSPLDQIDPNTIATIEVFSGPAASTLYGPDAANGVIVVTTKRGRPGPTQWNASYRHSRTGRPGDFPLGYYPFGHNFANAGNSIFCTIQNLSCMQDSLVTFQAINDPALTILDVGHTNDLSLSASGGNQALTFALTGSFNDEIGPLKLPTYAQEWFLTHFNRPAPDWMTQPHHYKTWDVMSNVHASLGKTADVTWLASVGRSEQQRTSLEQQLASLMSVYIDPLNGFAYPQGSLVWATDPSSSSAQFLSLTPQPISDLLQGYYTRSTASALTFRTGAQVDWHPRAWLHGGVQTSVDLVSRSDETWLPDGLTSATDSGYLARGTGRSIIGNFRVFGQTQHRLWHGLTLTTTLGADLTTTTTNDVGVSASSLVPGTSSLAGAHSVSANEMATNTSVFGWFLEPNITGRRFGLSTGFRLDGGSNYGAHISGGLLALPKLNGTWTISEESWFPFRGVFSSLRLRGGYGQSQVQPSATDRLRLYGSSGVPGGVLILQDVGNTDLRPERSTEINGGFDADMLDSRVSVQFNLYRKRQVDALMDAVLPPSVDGGGTVRLNLGNVRNAGIDVTFDLTPIRSPVVTWHAQLLYNRNTNVLEKLGPGVLPNKTNGWVEGYPLGSRWARPILGYADLNGDNEIQINEIQVGDSLEYMGRLYPAYTTALSTDMSLFGRALSVAATFSYSHGATQVNQTAHTNWVLEPAFSDPKTPLAQQVAIVASTFPVDGNGQTLTDYGLIQDVSTFRFQSLSVRYRVPAMVTHALRMQELSVAIQGSNLGLHSTYAGKDPDVSAWSPGESVVDTGQLPTPRLWQLSVNVRY